MDSVAGWLVPPDMHEVAQSMPSAPASAAFR